ncbi:hypothetical protein [Paraburkholderia tuberum]|uniref:Uncharacterized protein n=1 Tax=Paraburkholderia tuberum TaxID=157910 RepID=A0A1H1GW81_9BURK|nr:hypothetical protein [Paraburkholderia tuberum]SDR17158.1 hypothetical protein SAMN05445850_3108 [Paraburkholderia tuberum]
MTPYHGTPITPNTAAVRAISGGHAFVSFAYPEQLGLVLEVCQSFAGDNGAYPAWRSGRPITDWNRYYAWVAELHRYPTCDFFVIPDVIDGDEAENDALLDEWPWRHRAPWIGAPVWHLHESLERLERLASTWPRVCLGSSGQFATIGTDAWYTRMSEAMNVVCDRDGRPICKLHGLRMLNPDVFTRFPFASADATTIGRNIGLDSKWKGTIRPPTKESRAQVMRDRIEIYQSPTFWERSTAPIQQAFALEVA